MDATLLDVPLKYELGSCEKDHTCYEEGVRHSARVLCLDWVRHVTRRG